MLRLFIGIPLENMAQEKLTAFYGEFDSLKTVKKENLHITLQFLGDMEEKSLEPLKEAVDRACEGIHCFEASCTRISAFPNTRRAMAVWANVDAGSAAVRKIFRALEDRLSGFKFKREKRAFIPHVTMARSKSPLDISAAAGRLKFDIRSKIGKVVLFSSVLEPSGPVYTRVYERALESAEK
jgi:2'-5' RNA ligase